MRLPLGLLVACLVATVASYIGAADRLTWFLEAFPVLLVEGLGLADEGVEVQRREL